MVLNPGNICQNICRAFVKKILRFRLYLQSFPGWGLWACVCFKSPHKTLMRITTHPQLTTFCYPNLPGPLPGLGQGILTLPCLHFSTWLSPQTTKLDHPFCFALPLHTLYTHLRHSIHTPLLTCLPGTLRRLWI